MNRNLVPLMTMTKYRELWLRLMDIFPTVMTDMERGHEDKTILYENYRYNAVVSGSGYMVWVLPCSNQVFWQKAILPILDEYRKERVTWSRHRYNTRAFLVKLPLNVDGVQSFRDWAKSGSTDVESFAANEWSYDDDYADYPYEDWWDSYDEDEPYAEYSEYAEKFERKERRRC